MSSSVEPPLERENVAMASESALMHTVQDQHVNPPMIPLAVKRSAIRLPLALSCSEVKQMACPGVPRISEYIQQNIVMELTVLAVLECAVSRSALQDSN